MIPVDKTDKRLKKALDVVGNKWSALILYNLHRDGPTRFIDCQKAEGINPRTLTQRLDYLEKVGLISKKAYNEYPPRCEYSLTTRGKSLIPALESLIKWVDKD